MSLYKVEVRRIIKIIRKDKSLPEQNSISGSENIARKGTPQCLRLSAVFTLEAAVVMPVLACFFVSVLFFFRIMQIQLEVQKALDDTGRKLAVCAAAVSSDGAALPGIAEALLLREMADRTEAETYITGGKFGISLIGSDFSGEEITLRAAYHIRLPSGSSGCGILRWNSGQIAGNGQDGVLQREVMKISGCMSHRQEPSITGSIPARIWSCRSGLWRRRK